MLHLIYNNSYVTYVLYKFLGGIEDGTQNKSHKRHDSGCGFVHYAEERLFSRQCFSNVNVLKLKLPQAKHYIKKGSRKIDCPCR